VVGCCTCVSGSPILVTGAGGGTVTASAMQAALAGLAGCETVGTVWSPASNDCPPVAAGLPDATGIVLDTGGVASIAVADISYATRASVTTAITTAEAASDPSGSASAAQSVAISPAVSTNLQRGSNLSDLASASTARTNLGLGSAATTSASAYDAAGTAAAAQAASLQIVNNLSDLTNSATARTNLGLGSAATASSGGAAATLGTGCTWYQGGAAGFTASTTLSLTTTASAINAFVFIYDGTNCYGNHIVYCSEECRDKWGRKARRAASRLKAE
jgi:hypothetical protein